MYLHLWLRRQSGEGHIQGIKMIWSATSLSCWQKERTVCWRPFCSASHPHPYLYVNICKSTYGKRYICDVSPKVVSFFLFVCYPHTQNDTQSSRDTLSLPLFTGKSGVAWGPCVEWKPCKPCPCLKMFNGKITIWWWCLQPCLDMIIKGSQQDAFAELERLY